MRWRATWSTENGNGAENDVDTGCGGYVEAESPWDENLHERVWHIIGAKMELYTHVLVNRGHGRAILADKVVARLHPFKHEVNVSAMPAFLQPYSIYCTDMGRNGIVQFWACWHYGVVAKLVLLHHGAGA